MFFQNYIRKTKMTFICEEDERRFTLFPLKHYDLWEKYKNHVNSFWIVEEIDLSGDVVDWNTKLNEKEKMFITHIIAFFAGSDGVVLENLVNRFMREVKIPEAKCFYSIQILMETVHSEMYSLLIDTYINCVNEKKKLFQAIETFPHIKKKADWAVKWIESDRNFTERLVAFVIVEGLFFCGSFCAIFWLKQRNLLHGLCHSNEFISRDESLHCEFAILLFNKYCKEKPEKEIIYKMFREAVDIEIDFITSAVPVSLIGMNSDLMSEYIKFVADYLLQALGFQKLYHAQNPFPFMDMISLSDKCNFFEKRVSSYRKGMSASNASDNEFSLTNIS